MKKSSNPAAAGAVHPTKTFLIGCRPFEVMSNTVPDTIRESGDVGPVDALSATRSVVEETVTSNRRATLDRHRRHALVRVRGAEGVPVWPRDYPDGPDRREPGDGVPSGAI